MGPDEDSLPETLANNTGGKEKELSSCVTNHQRLRRTTPTETWKGLRPFPSPLWMPAVNRLQPFEHELHSPFCFSSVQKTQSYRFSVSKLLADRPLKAALLLSYPKHL